MGPSKIGMAQEWGSQGTVNPGDKRDCQRPIGMRRWPQEVHPSVVHGSPMRGRE